MTTEANTVLSDEQIAEIEALSARVPDGPWFADADIADDVPNHRRSGLALVDTGRSGDWWIARLCEWHIANFIAASKTNVDALCATVKALRAEITTSDQEWQSRLAEVERERDRILKLYNEAWLWVQQRVKHPNSGLPPAAMTLIEMLPLLNQRAIELWKENAALELAAELEALK